MLMGFTRIRRVDFFCFAKNICEKYLFNYFLEYSFEIMNKIYIYIHDNLDKYCLCIVLEAFGKNTASYDTLAI